MAISNVTLNREISNYANPSLSKTNTESKQIQSQIALKQQRLNQLSSDQQMSAQEKDKERLELQQQIAELNRKLQLLREEQKEETSEAKKEELLAKQADEKNSQEDDDTNAETTPVTEPSDAPFQNMKGILAADFLMQKEKIQERVTQIQDGTENVLEAEIKLDQLHGTETGAKKEQLEELRKKETIQIEVPRQENPPHVGINTGAKIIIRE